jgi:NADH-quinone oxidoreductase subunit C
MTEVSQIIESITGSSKQEPNASPATYLIESNHLLAVCRELHENPITYFDQLSCVTGIDNGPQAGTMEVIYTLYSIPFHKSIMLKVILQRENAEIESVSLIWKSANWMEREVYDMFGIHFKNHPDLRRILMPADWEGYPLRKDFQHQEEYRGITVKYDQESN